MKTHASMTECNDMRFWWQRFVFREQYCFPHDEIIPLPHLHIHHLTLFRNVVRHNPNVLRLWTFFCIEHSILSWMDASTVLTNQFWYHVDTYHTFTSRMGLSTALDLCGFRSLFAMRLLGAFGMCH